MSELNFQSCQVVYLEHEDMRLFAEVIQVVRERQVCWVRPLLMVATAQPSAVIETYDLRQAADLLWPLILFQPALDTEFITLLGSLSTLEFKPEEARMAQQRLSNFVWQFWQTHPTAFQG